MKKPPPVEEAGEKAPFWIISFADMISLLMAFFIMLLTMSTTQSGNLCENGIGFFESTMSGFRNSISQLGIPGIIGGNDVNQNTQQYYYPVEGQDENTSNTRLIDGNEERTKRAFSRIQARASTSVSRIKGTRQLFTVTPIAFGAGQCELPDAARQYLDGFCADLKAAQQPESIFVVVVGLAPDAGSFREKWTLSSVRAEKVCVYIRQLLADTPADVLAWGSGSACTWTKDSSKLSEQSYILLSIVSKKPAD